MFLKYLRSRGTPYIGRALSNVTGAAPAMTRSVISTLPQTAADRLERPKVRTAQSRFNFNLLPYYDASTGETAQHRAAYEKMIGDSTIKAALLGKALAVSSLDLEVMPDDEDSPREQECAEFVKWVLLNQEGGTTGLVQALTIPKLMFGYVLSQPKMKMVERGKYYGKWKIDRFATKPPSAYTLGMNEFGEVQKVIGQGFNSGEEYDPNQFVISHYMRLFDNPLGMSDLRAAYRCYDDETEILTKDGWKRFDSLSDADEVAALDTSNGPGRLVYEKPTERVSYPYQGKMFSQVSRNIDLCVTPNHRMYVGTREARRFEMVEASQLMDGSRSKMVRYKRNAEWVGEEVATFTLPAISYSQKLSNHTGENYGTRTTEVPARDLPMDDWLRFFGYFLAEGSTYRKKDGTKQCFVSLTQNAGPVLEEMKQLAERLGFTYCIKNKTSSKALTLEISNLQLWTYLSQFGKSRDKYIPTELKALSSRQLLLMLDAMLAGDGRHEGSQYATMSKRMADDVAELALKTGRAANVYQEECQGTDEGYIWIVGINHASVDGNLVNTHQTDGRSWVDYDGMVHCVTVPSGIVFVRRNGKACWCGNSYWLIDTTWKLRAIFLEKFSTPSILGKYTNEDDKLALDEALAAFRAATYMTIPEGAAIEAINIASKGTADYEAALRDLRAEVALGIQGAALQMLEGQFGTRAQASVHKEGSELFIWYLARDLENDLNRYVVPDIVDLNYWGIGNPPTVVFGGINDEVMKASLEIDKGLMELGLELSKSAAYKRYGRTPPVDDEDILKKAAPPPSPFGMPAGGPAPLPFDQGGGNPESFAESWDENEHPRDKDGKFIDAGLLVEAKADPKKAAALRQNVAEKDRFEYDKIMERVHGTAYRPHDAVVKAKSTNPIVAAPGSGPPKNKAEKRGSSDAVGGREFASPEEIDQWEKSHFGKWRAGLSNVEKNAVRKYTDEYYEGINTYLRSGNDPGRDSDEVAVMVKAIDSSLTKASIPEDVVAFRGMSYNPGLKKGSVFQDKAFVSTSLSREEAEFFADGHKDGVLMEIKIPKGAKGAMIDDLSGLPEQELLLPRQSKFKVIGKRKKGDYTVYTAELIHA